MFVRYHAFRSNYLHDFYFFGAEILFQFKVVDNFLFSLYVALEKMFWEDFNLIYMQVTKPTRVLLSLKC